MITRQEKELARMAMELALGGGASAVRITLTKSTEDIVATLCGEVDRVSRCADTSMAVALFADGRFGSFSINKLDPQSLSGFIAGALETVHTFAPDPFRRLPEPARYCTGARTGLELGLVDPAHDAITPDDRVRMALEASVGEISPRGTSCLGRNDSSVTSLKRNDSSVISSGAKRSREISLPDGAKVISEEGEYSDSRYDCLVLDSQGLECLHSETTYDYGVEVTVEDRHSAKYSDYWWTSAPLLAGFDASGCGLTAVRRACSQIGSKPQKSGKYNMVVGTEAASRLVSPLLSALNAYSIQQGNSFLAGCLGKKVFHEGLTILDEPIRPGETGSKLFDGEGIACSNAPVIECGVVKRYSVNTYMAGKMDMEPTVEDVTRARLAPWNGEGKDAEALMQMCGSGILVTDFNGGNCNPTTGDFSYGISGQLFRGGKPVRPVSEMLITGNFLQLWQHLLAAGTDYRLCSSKLIPSLAFSEVDFSG